MAVTFKMLDAACESARRAGILHGAVVAAGTADSLHVLQAWGNASVYPEKKQMCVDSIFDVASITKAVATASACGTCIERGLLSPDAPATEYLPNLGYFPGSIIKIRDLATHSSGYDNRKFYSHGPENIIEAAITSPAQYPAGYRYEYSCRNFIVLGRIIEIITGNNLSDFCNINIFKPAGMHGTSFGPLTGRRESVVPTSQPAGIISDEQARIACTALGNAGLFSTAGDLSAFCMMMLRGGKAKGTTLFSQQAINWLTKPCSRYGMPRKSFGWDMSSRRESLHRPPGLSPSAIGHSGWTGQSVWIDPVKNIFTVVLTNRTHHPGSRDNYRKSKIFRAKIAKLLISIVTR